MPIKIKVWKCEFCAAYNTSRDKIIRHEYECGLNPENNSCFTCEHFTPSPGYKKPKKCSVELDLHCGTRIFCSKHKLKGETDE